MYAIQKFRLNTWNVWKPQKAETQTHAYRVEISTTSLTVNRTTESLKNSSTRLYRISLCPGVLFFLSLLCQLIYTHRSFYRYNSIGRDGTRILVHDAKKILSGPIQIIFKIFTIFTLKFLCLRTVGRTDALWSPNSVLVYWYYFSSNITENQNFLLWWYLEAESSF